MFSLSTRLAIVMVVSVIGVVALAAGITSMLVRGPPLGEIERSMAARAVAISNEAAQSPHYSGRPGIHVGTIPPHSVLDPRQTHHMRWLIRRQGSHVAVRVIEGPRHDDRRIAIPAGGDRFAFLPFPRPPDIPLRNLAFYLSLVAIGVTGIAIYAANRMMRPLRMLDETIAALGPDGMIPPLPETGAPEIRATAKTINRLSNRLNAVTESRMRLVAAAGHDLRTPMTRMRLRTEFIEDEEDRQSWLTDIDELDRIADSAIRLVREEVSSDPSEEVEIDGMVREIALELKDIGMPVELKVVDRATAIVAPFAVKRALRNLVTNAATHGGGAEIAVSTRAGSTLIVIEDEGPGIPGALIDRVFEPFFRVDEGRRQFHPGAGLGFAIAREIILRNGGHLTIENRLPRGLRQTVTFDPQPRGQR